MKKKTDLKNQIRDLVKAKQNQTGTRYFLYCYNEFFKVYIETENASRCCLFKEQKALEFLKIHRKTEITIYKTAGQELPEWSKGKKATIAEILPGMVPALVQFLSWQHPTMYDRIAFEVYSARLTQEEKEIFAGFSRITRHINHE
jgi:hypothetical protein